MVKNKKKNKKQNKKQNVVKKPMSKGKKIVISIVSILCLVAICGGITVGVIGTKQPAEPIEPVEPAPDKVNVEVMPNILQTQENYETRPGELESLNFTDTGWNFQFNFINGNDNSTLKKIKTNVSTYQDNNNNVAKVNYDYLLKTCNITYSRFEVQDFENNVYLSEKNQLVFIYDNNSGYLFDNKSNVNISDLESKGIIINNLEEPLFIIDVIYY